MLSSQVSRGIAPRVISALQASPVVALTGARTTGKSTLARELVESLQGTWVDLDDPATRQLALASPHAFVRGLPEPIVIDEFQRAPDLLSAIKAELNTDRRPGRYLLAGSARHEAVPQLADYLTGRVELFQLWPFAMAELEPGVPTAVDRLLGGELPTRAVSGLSREELLGLVLRGGYPIPVSLDEPARSRWFASLAELAIARISADVATVRRTEQLHKFLTLLAAGTAQTRNAAEVGRELGLGRDQSVTYLRLLELVYLACELPAWSTNLVARVTKRPKLHLVDSGLAAHLQRLTPQQLSATDPAGATRFERLLETFVATEILKQLGWADTEARLYHFRTSDQIEVDLVLETAAGKIAAIEVKAATRARPVDTRGLTYLRDKIGDRFVAGVLLNTGGQAQVVDDRIAVAPVEWLWR